MIYAEIIIDHTYITVIEEEEPNITPLSLSNYMDDSLIIWTGSQQSFLKFKDLLGNIWPSVKFEEEIEEGVNGITFLDMRIKRNSNNKITHTFYQKPTHSGTYLHYSSHCALYTKINIIRM